MKKLCKKCLLILPADAFYKKHGKCKECVKQSVRENRLSKIEYYRQFDRMRGSIPHRVSARKEYQQTADGKRASSRAKKKYANNNKYRRAAHSAVANALKSGRLQRQPCFICGEKAEAHHPAYDLPLSVTWLCDKHHKETHKLGRELERNAA